MRVLVTGAAGFIGTYLIQRLRQEDSFEIFEFDRERLTRDRYFRGDVSDWYSLDVAFRKAQPELVVHLGAMVSRRECEETPNVAISTNAGATLNVCTMCVKYQARLLYAGSSEEYGTAFAGNRVVDEETPFGEPTGIYGMTKRMAEEVVQHFSYAKGLQATTVRFFMLYGPGEKTSGYRSALIRFMDAASKGQPLIVHTETERSWCFAPDAMEALRKIIGRKQAARHEVFNVGRDEPVSSEQLAQKIVEIASSSSLLKRVPPEPMIIPVKRGSFQKASKELGWEATTPLDEGLRRTWSWFTKNARDLDDDIVVTP
jgi:nucleoside-diphosphate-sugar epimerase